MKKIISILLAMLMMFSFVTVAFAEDATTAAPETETTAPAEDGEEAIDLGEYDWLLDLPFWTVGPALKFAKIALKLVSVYLKVAKIFGLVEEDMGDMIMKAIIDMIQDAQNSTEEAPENTTAPAEAPETTTAAAA